LSSFYLHQYLHIQPISESGLQNPIFTSAKEVVFIGVLVCLLAGLRKNYSTDFQKFGVKVAHGPRKKPLDFSGNPDHVTLQLGMIGVGWVKSMPYSAWQMSRCTVIWVTNQLGDRQLGDNLTGQQPTERHILVNWATTLEG